MTRRIENRIEVPGTPEEVWELIATGHGIEAWFVPAEVEPRVGGRVAIDIGHGHGGRAARSPPGSRRTASPTRRSGSSRGPARSEFLVEAQSGGTCVVRLVSTLHADGGDWDRLLEDLHTGWDGYLLILRLYCEHFAGRRVHDDHRRRRVRRPTRRRAFTGLVRRPRASSAPRSASASRRTSGPRLAGVVEHRAEQELIVRIDEPAPGVALLFAYPMGGQVRTFVHLYLYGAADEGEAERWRDWMAVPSAG